MLYSKLLIVNLKPKLNWLSYVLSAELDHSFVSQIGNLLGYLFLKLGQG